MIMYRVSPENVVLIPEYQLKVKRFFHNTKENLYYKKKKTFKMAEGRDFYSARVLQQRVPRKRKKVNYEQIFDDESKCDISSSSDSVDMLDFQLLNNTTTTTTTST